MVTPALVQSKVWFGYAQSAKRLGFTFAHYRPSSVNSPIAPANLIGSLPLALVQNFNFAAPMKFGNAQWQALVDGSQVQVGDYFVGPAPGSSRTVFIAGMWPMLPIQAVECNRVLNILRVGNEERQYGIGGYSGDTETTEVPLLTGWPASVLEGKRPQATDAKLPGDAKIGAWAILMPALPGVAIEFNDIITDDLARRYLVQSAELTPLGWRITAQQEEP